MRVISGSAKGITLASVPGKSTRPITDRVKEALFNILGADVYDTDWLDLFGGTGAVGIEALSRGANSVEFIEINFRAFRVIQQNLETCGLAEFASVRKMDAFTYLNSRIDHRYDFIYIAPPQYLGIWVKALQTLDENPDWVAKNGKVIVQIHPKEYASEVTCINFNEVDQRDYGDTRLVFYDRVSQE